MADIVLIYPKTGTNLKRVIAPPHSLLAIAALPDDDGYNVKIIDQRVEPNFSRILEDELYKRPYVVGISTMTGMQIKYAINIAKEVRKLSPTPIVWGGKHPSLLPQQVLDSGLADDVCVGEGDIQFYKKFKEKRLCSGVWETSEYVDMEELSEIPWHLIDIEQYIKEDMYLPNSPRTLDVGESSRGCSFRCGFCSQANTKWRPISAEQTIERVTRLVKEHNLTGVWFRDDEFYINIDRAVKICEGLMPLNIKWYTSGTRIDLFNKTPLDACKIYKRGGASVLKFGAESGSDRILGMINKGFKRDDILKANLKCKQVGITPAYNFIGGFPTQTFEEYDETIDLIVQLKEDNPSARFEVIGTFAPMPGTPLFDMAIEYGLKPPEKLEGWINWRFDEDDTSGTRNPWYSQQERDWIGNIVYLSALANGLDTMIESYNGSIMGKLMRLAYSLPKKYLDYKFEKKQYRSMPEMGFIKWLRKQVSYR